MKALIAAASILLVWDDPLNDPSKVAGYNVYRVEHLGTGEMIRHRVNAELIPWVEDTEHAPSLWIHGVQPGEEYRGTAVGKLEFYPDGAESEISDDFYVVPAPPVAVRWRATTPP